MEYRYRGGKSSLLEGGVRSLALIGGGYIPQDQQGWKRTSLMHGADWTPTILSLAGVDVNQIDRDLQTKLYQPILEKAKEKQKYSSRLLPKISSNKTDRNANGINFIDNDKDNTFDKLDYNYGYGISSPSFDGIDLSRWLIYGDENDNPRRNVGLSINDWNSSLIGIVFVSNLTNHRYKLINNFYGRADYCKFCTDEFTGARYRCQESADLFDNSILFDLTLDYNETTNLYPYTMKTKEQLKKFIEMNNKTNEYLQKKQLKLLKEKQKQQKKQKNEKTFDEHKVSRIANKNVDFELKKEINDIWDYFVYGDGNAVTEGIWEEGKRIVGEYTQNSFYNSYSDCQTETFPSAANPTLFDNVWTPWWDFDEYSRKMQTWCGDDLNPVLMDLYTTTYDQDA